MSEPGTQPDDRLDRHITALYRELGAEVRSEYLAPYRGILVTERLPSGLVVRSLVIWEADTQPIDGQAVSGFASAISSLLQSRSIHTGVIVSPHSFSREAQAAALRAEITLMDLADLKRLARKRKEELSAIRRGPRPTLDSPSASKLPHAALIAGLIAIMLLTVWILVVTWPPGAGLDIDSQSTIGIFGSHIGLSGEERLLLLVGAAGGLGSLLRSIVWLGAAVGSRRHLARYLALPYLYWVFGAGIALLFTLLIEAAFLPTATSGQIVNPFGYVAMGTLAGVFASQPVSKLAELFDTVFTPLPERVADSVERRLLGAPLDNYSGYVSLHFAVGGDEILPSDEGLLTLPQQNPVDVGVTFSPDPQNILFGEAIRISEGQVSKEVTFEIRPEADNVDFNPCSASITIRDQRESSQVTFVAVASTPGESQWWIHILQRNRLVQVVRLHSAIIAVGDPHLDIGA